MKKKQCEYCNKTYKPKSNHSKYCSKKCKNKRDNETRTIKYQKDKEYRKNILNDKSQRWRERYHNEPGFKEKHHNQIKKYRATEKGKQYERNKAKKYYYENHEENKKKQAQLHKEKYWNDKKNRENILKNNREYKKTKNGKIADARHRNKRRRELSFIPLWINPFPKEIQVDYHHINNILTIPIPKITHLYVAGVNKKEHLKHNEKWIQKIYLFDLELIKK